MKTQVTAIEGKQELWITRVFDLPVNLVYQAFVVPELVAQWMGTKVVELEVRQHAGYLFETTDPHGQVHRFHGAFHDVEENVKIYRTFEMAGTPFPVQLELLHFESLGEKQSKLTMQVIYVSNEMRDNHLKMPFVQGINWAHQRLESLFN